MKGRDVQVTPHAATLYSPQRHGVLLTIEVGATDNRCACTHVVDCVADRLLQRNEVRDMLKTATAAAIYSSLSALAQPASWLKLRTEPALGPRPPHHRRCCCCCNTLVHADAQDRALAGACSHSRACSDNSRVLILPPAVVQAYSIGGSADCHAATDPN